MFNKIMSLIIIMCFFSSFCMAECDWKTGVTQQGDNFLYNKDCHLKVGQLVEESKLREEQVAKLNKTIELKDLMIAQSEARVELWRNTSYKLEDKYLSQQKWDNLNRWVYLGLGIALTVAAGFTIGYASRH